MSAHKLSIRTVACLTTLAVSLAFVGDTRAEEEAEDQVAARYVPPLSIPYLNESPQITTELRPIYMYNKQPKSFFRSGHTNIVSLQLRYAITDRFALLVTKNGWTDFNTSSRSQITSDDGWLNLAFGFKWAWVNDPANNSFFSLGVRYEAPSGDLTSRGLIGLPDPTAPPAVPPTLEQVPFKLKMQGNGDGFINVFMTGSRLWQNKWRRMQWLGPVGIQSSFGLNHAVDTGENSSFVHGSIHLDYEIFRNAFIVMETNMIANADEGSRTVGIRGSDGSKVTMKDLKNVEGYDLVNFGSDNPGTVFTYAAGARYKITDRFLFGAGYEVPIGGRKDILDWRVMVDAIIKL
jgi:hypothetical protein